MSNKFLKVFFSDRKKVNNLEEVLQKLPKNSYFIFREYDLGKNERLFLSKKLLKICKNHKIKFIVGKDFNLAKAIKADGCHYSDFTKIDIRILQFKKTQQDFILSYSCHNLKSVFFAKKIKADLVFISPIFATTSHKEVKFFGKIGFLKIMQQYPKILPLGGVDKKNITFFKKNGALGFGAIDYFNKISNE